MLRNDNVTESDYVLLLWGIFNEGKQFLCRSLAIWVISLITSSWRHDYVIVEPSFIHYVIVQIILIWPTIEKMANR